MRDKISDKSKGYTVIELVAVLTIIGVVSLLATPVFSRTLAGYQLKQAADRMAWEIRAQQQEAITAGASRQIEFVLYGNYYKILKPCRRNIQLPEQVEYNYISIPETNNRYLLNFNILGCPNLGGTIALKNKYEDNYYVIITPVIGRIRVSDVPPE